MTLADAFLADILDNPQDDFPRLVYADALEENAGTVPCDRCHGGGGRMLKAKDKIRHAPGECPTCGMSGRVPDVRAARAEFIRCQVELAKVCGQCHGTDSRWPKCPYCGSEGNRIGKERMEALRRRELELFLRHCHEWMPPALEELRLVPALSGGGANFRRGFISEVFLTCADFAGGACGRCNGTKRIRVTDGEALERIRRRGGHPMFPPGRYAQCHACRGTGRTPGHAATIFACCPIEKVTLADGPEPVGPITGGPDQGKWFFSRRDVPDWLWPRFFDNGVTDHMITTHSVPTREDALRQRSAACVRYARAAAKGGT